MTERPSYVALTVVIDGFRSGTRSIRASRRTDAARSRSTLVARARRSTPAATSAISSRWRATSSRFSETRVRSSRTSSFSFVFRRSASHARWPAIMSIVAARTATSRQPRAAFGNPRSSCMLEFSGEIALFNGRAICQEPAILRPSEELLRVLPDLAREVLATHHAGELGHALGRRERPGRRVRPAVRHPLRHHDVMLGERGDERQMRDAEHLTRAPELSELLPDHLGDGAADPRVDLVEDEARAAIFARGERLQREHDARQLAARCDLREPPRLQTAR